jgi:transposase
MARTQRELTDAQWAKLAPLLPPQRPRMGRPPKDHRLIVEAIVRLDRTGVPWRDLPGATRRRCCVRSWRPARRGGRGAGPGSARPRSQATRATAFPTLRRNLRRRVGIPNKSNQPRQRGFNRAAYRERNRVERTINRLKQWRRVATRYQKREANYLAMVTIAAIVLLWLQ